MALPHEGHVPTLPGRTNTGERYVSFKDKHGAGHAGAEYRYHPKPDVTVHFAPTTEGFAAAIAYRDAVLAGLPAERTFTGLDRYMDQVLEGQKITVSASQRTVVKRNTRRLKAQMIALYGDRCQNPICPTPTTPFALDCSYTDLAHITPVKDLEGVLSTTLDDLMNLCPTCHRVFDHAKNPEALITLWRAHGASL